MILIIDNDDYEDFKKMLKTGEFEIFRQKITQGTKYPRTYFKYTYKYKNEIHRVIANANKKYLMDYAKKHKLIKLTPSN